MWLSVEFHMKHCELIDSLIEDRFIDSLVVPVDLLWDSGDRHLMLLTGAMASG
jgi:hypothetical protein